MNLKSSIASQQALLFEVCMAHRHFGMLNCIQVSPLVVVWVLSQQVWLLGQPKKKITLILCDMLCLLQLTPDRLETTLAPCMQIGSGSRHIF